MTPEKIRARALAAALELRTGQSNPGAIIIIAKKFAAYLAGDGESKKAAPKK
jgi:hypothetical protein